MHNHFNLYLHFNVHFIQISLVNMDLIDYNMYIIIL